LAQNNRNDQPTYYRETVVSTNSDAFNGVWIVAGNLDLPNILQTCRHLQLIWFQLQKQILLQKELALHFSFTFYLLAGQFSELKDVLTAYLHILSLTLFVKQSFCRII
jgi:hypothetical protein